MPTRRVAGMSSEHLVHGGSIAEDTRTFVAKLEPSGGQIAPHNDHYRPLDLRASITTDGLSIRPLIEVPGSTLNDHAVGSCEAPPMAWPPMGRRDGTTRPAQQWSRAAGWLAVRPALVQSRDMRGRTELQSICT